MFLYKDENNEEYLITKYIVEHNLDINTFSFWLLDADEVEVYYDEFINYDEIYKYLGQLRFNYLER